MEIFKSAIPLAFKSCLIGSLLSCISLSVISLSGLVQVCLCPENKNLEG